MLQANDGVAQPDFPESSANSTSRDWLRCDATGANCVSTGVSAPTYTLTAPDVGHAFMLEVTATSNLGTTATAFSDPTSQVRTDPSNDTSPIIAGTARDGETFTITFNSWSGSGAITLTYQWFRCTADGATCNPIPGATAPTYVLTPAEIGSRLFVQVTGDSAGGPSKPSVPSPLSPVVEVAPPVNTVRPEISGTLRQGRLLTLSQGTWTGTLPISYGYRWQRCTGQTVASCENISGATDPEYRLTANDVANRLRVVVTANNSAPGSVTATSPLTDDVLALEPTAAAPRLLSPFPRVTIGGIARRRGSQISLLHVRAPTGALVTVFCRGRGCPFRTARRRIGRRRFVRIIGLERILRPRTEIELLITRPGTIGKYTRFLIRRGKRPKRRDACVRPGATGPSPCP